MDEEMIEKIEEINLRKLKEEADPRIINFHERFIDILKRLFKGIVTFKFNRDEHEIIYTVYLFTGKNYNTKITFSEIVNPCFIDSVFINEFIEYVKHDYLKNILN